MTIQINITDITNENPDTLKQLANFLLILSGEPPKDTITTTIHDSKQTLKDLNSAIEQFTKEELEEPEAIISNHDVQPYVEKSPSEIFRTNQAPTIIEVLDKKIQNLNSLEIDTRGVPWDARIHTRTKSKRKDGVWKPMRGVDMLLVDKIEKELIANKTIEQGVNIPPSAPILSIPKVPKPPQVSEVIDDFPHLMDRIVQNVQHGVVKSSQVIEILNKKGIANLAELGTRLDMVPEISKLFKQELDI